MSLETGISVIILIVTCLAVVFSVGYIAGFVVGDSKANGEDESDASGAEDDRG